MLRAQRAGLPNLEEEVEEGGRRFWDTEVRPRGVVKVVDIPRLPRLKNRKRVMSAMIGALCRQRGQAKQCKDSNGMQFHFTFYIRLLSNVHAHHGVLQFEDSDCVIGLVLLRK